MRRVGVDSAGRRRASSGVTVLPGAPPSPVCERLTVDRRVSDDDESILPSIFVYIENAILL